MSVFTDRCVAETPNEGTILQVGAYLGAETLEIARSIASSGRRIRLLIVDDWKRSSRQQPYNSAATDNHGEVLDRFSESMRSAGIWHLISTVSPEGDDVDRQIPDSSVDFAIVDAAVDYHSLAFAVQKWWKKVRPGGWIGGRDFGVWSGVTMAIRDSFPSIERIESEACWLVQKTSENQLVVSKMPWRVAVVTPCYRPLQEPFSRCLASVFNQSFPCTHYLVADGCHLTLPKSPLYTKVTTIPGPHHDTGNAGRAVGSTLAISDNFDAIAYLDCDNWYHKDHIDSMVKVAMSSEADVVTSGRMLISISGEVLGRCPHVDGQTFVDTNCMMLTKKAFGIASVWSRIPWPLRLIGDRVVWKEILRLGKRCAHTGMATVAYRTLYKEHYRMFGKTVPPGAKYLANSSDGIESRTEG